MFAHFDPPTLACFTEADVERLLTDAGIVRNRGKIESAIGNARATVAMLDRGESLDALCWSFQPPPSANSRSSDDELVTMCPESVALSKELKRRGFRFVGPTTMYAFMQSAGLINDHVDGCWVQSRL